MRKGLRWAILISGRGSNLQAIMDLGDDRLISVISNRKKAAGVCKAKRQGVPVFFYENWTQLDQLLRKLKITNLFLLGFMKLIPPDFVEKWQGRIINLHPSMLPSFPGLNAIELSYDAQGAMGVTVHEVVAEMDAGPILLKKEAVSREMRESLTLDQAKFLISKAEQDIVRKIFLNWRNQE